MCLRAERAGRGRCLTWGSRWEPKGATQKPCRPTGVRSCALWEPVHRKALQADPGLKSAHVNIANYYRYHGAEPKVPASLPLCKGR